MKIKHIREIKVGIVAVVCLFLLYFGFNFLKGVNIFSPVHNFYGTYAAVNGLTEQSPVYIRGYKVGQVDWIHYDFTADSAFTVRISVNKDISLPKGTTMDLIADGLLGGGAVQLSVPTATQAGFATSSENYESGDFLPTQVIPGLMDNLSSGLLGDLDSTILAAKVLIKNVNNQLADDHLHSALARIDSLSGELTVSSHALSQLLTQRVSGIVDNLDTTLANVSVITTDVRNANLAATVGRVDTVARMCARKKGHSDNSFMTSRCTLMSTRLYNPLILSWLTSKLTREDICISLSSVARTKVTRKRIKHGNKLYTADTYS